MAFENIDARLSALLAEKKIFQERALLILRLQHDAILREDSQSAQSYADLADCCIRSSFAVEKSILALKRDVGEGFLGSASAELEQYVLSLDEKISFQIEQNIDAARSLTEKLRRQIDSQKKFFSGGFSRQSGRLLEVEA